MPTIFDLLLFIKLDKFVKDKGRKKFFDIFIIVLILLEIIIVQKYRMTALGLLICIMLFVFLFRSKGNKKIAYFIFGCVAIGVLINTTFFQGILDTIFSGGDAYLLTRSKGRALYLTYLSNHPFLGCGYPSMSNAISLEASGYNNGLLLNDNGIIGFIYLYGLGGIIWAATLWFNMISKGYSIYKRTNTLTFFIFPIFFIVTCLTEAHWYWEQGFLVFVLFLVLMESKMITKPTSNWPRN